MKLFFSSSNTMLLFFFLSFWLSQKCSTSFGHVPCIYIMQNGMICKDLVGKNEKGERQKVKNCIKNGVKGLNTFWVINSPRPPHLCTPGKKYLKGGGGGTGGRLIEKHNKYQCSFHILSYCINWVKSS